MALNNKNDRTSKISQMEESPLYKQLKYKLTKQITKAYTMPHTFCNPLIAQQLQYATPIDDWLRKEGCYCYVDRDTFLITIDLLTR